MNTEPHQTNWQRSTTSRFLDWLLSWRGARALLIAAAIPITLVALFYAVENWRGASAWKKCRRELEAKGEHLDFKALVPPPVPDEQNFAMTPLLRPLLDFERGPSGTKWRQKERKEKLGRISISLPRSGAKSPSLGDYQNTNLVDLVAWQQFYVGNTNYPQAVASASASADVLVALGKFDAELKELREASARPSARFPVSYSDEDPFGILLPHLASMKGISAVVVLRAIGRLEAGQTQDALEDLKLALRLADSIKQEPILISHLVRIANLAITLQGIREGLARHAWTDAQLAELEQRLATIDLLAEYSSVMRAERAWSLAGVEYYHRKGWAKGTFLGDGEAAGPSWEQFLRFAPFGWIRQNEVTISRLHQEFTLACVDDNARRVFPERAAGLEKSIQSMRRGPYNVFAFYLLPAVTRVTVKTARMQTGIDHVRLACALERHRLAHGQFPDTLDALAPRFLSKLPHDLMNGEPLKYHRTADGGYTIYSVGWNQKDDGGKVVFGRVDRKSRVSGSVRTDEGDWVWHCPVRTQVEAGNR